MKKENIYKFLYAVSVFCMIAFAIRLGADYFKYDGINHSAPFYVLVMERVVEFIVPSMVLFFAGKITKKKYAK